MLTADRSDGDRSRSEARGPSCDHGRGRRREGTVGGGKGRSRGNVEKRGMGGTGERHREVGGGRWKR